MSAASCWSDSRSVPVAWGHRTVLIKAYVHEVVICSGAKAIVGYLCSHGVDLIDLDLIHFLPLPMVDNSGYAAAFRQVSIPMDVLLGVIFPSRRPGPTLHASTTDWC